MPSFFESSNFISPLNFTTSLIFSASSFAGRYGSNQNRTPFNQGSGSTALETQQGILYIYNANDSSEYTYASFETTFRNAYGGALQGAHGGGAFTVTSAVDGIYFQQDSGNISSGTITLYKVV